MTSKNKAEKVGLFIREKLEDAALKHGKKRTSYRDLATAWDVRSHTQVYAWLEGRLFPPNNKIDKIATTLAQETGEKKVEIYDSLTELIKEARLHDTIEEPVRRDILRQVRSGAIRLGFVQYSHFSGLSRKSRNNSFCYSLAEVFTQYADVDHDDDRAVDLKNVTEELGADLEKRSSDEELDVVFGVLATSKRSFNLLFSQLPISIPVNAVIYGPNLEANLKSDTNWSNKISEKKGKKLIEALRDLVLDKASYSPEGVVPIIKSICAEDEIGYDFVKYAQAGHNAPLEIVEYNADQYREKLVEGDPNCLTVAIADEQMCLDIIKSAKTTNSNGKQLDPSDFLLLFNGPEAPIKDSKRRRPRYNLGYAINREQDEFFKFFTEAMDLFVETNPHIIMSLLDELKSELRDSTKFALNTTMKSREWRDRLQLNVTSGSVGESADYIVESSLGLNNPPAPFFSTGLSKSWQAISEEWRLSLKEN